MAEWLTVCAAEDIPTGAREVFDVDGRWVAVFNVDGQYYAIEDVCTHDGNALTEDAQGRPVPLEGYEIACPRHGARFDVRTGKVLRPPALRDVKAFPVRVQDGMIQLNVGT